ncbi:hypothetical protein pdam_00024115 [Pocillopora damicornis]|uniref:Uncharacterized protein n=1 Tax=Pocillopora damicornis TaxID=46731 RepID=A0A3M6UEQ7_POCDA|nr:hypothetical protein pdam_00024115 [Pocillopora damicornis]
MSYEERCILLNWNTLQHRRAYLSVVECYKTVFGLNGLGFDDYFEFCRVNLFISCWEQLTFSASNQPAQRGSFLRRAR